MEITKYPWLEILDKGDHRQKLFDPSHAFVWEVTQEDYCERNGGRFTRVLGIFNDPWEAVRFGVQQHCTDFSVRLALKKI